MSSSKREQPGRGSGRGRRVVFVLLTVLLSLVLILAGGELLARVLLPADLARRVRQQAKRHGQTISAIVAVALNEFLERLGAKTRDGRR